MTYEGEKGDGRCAGCLPLGIIFYSSSRCRTSVVMFDWALLDISPMFCFDTIWLVFRILFLSFSSRAVPLGVSVGFPFDNLGRTLKFYYFRYLTIAFSFQ